MVGGGEGGVGGSEGGVGGGGGGGGMEGGVVAVWEYGWKEWYSATSVNVFVPLGIKQDGLQFRGEGKVLLHHTLVGS